MIKVVIKDKSIKMTGHANYACYGKDIVCASASSIVITSINALLRIDKNSVKVNERSGYLEAELISNDDCCKKIFDNMIDLLQELSNNYPKNIIIRNEE